jgi:TRAP-type C4-dicarboxylate transport system permease small subunit
MEVIGRFRKWYACIITLLFVTFAGIALFWGSKKNTDAKRKDG